MNKVLPIASVHGTDYSVTFVNIDGIYTVNIFGTKVHTRTFPAEKAARAAFNKAAARLCAGVTIHQY